MSTIVDIVQQLDGTDSATAGAARAEAEVARAVAAVATAKNREEILQGTVSVGKAVAQAALQTTRHEKAIEMSETFVHIVEDTSRVLSSDAGDDVALALSSVTLRLAEVTRIASESPDHLSGVAENLTPIQLTSQSGPRIPPTPKTCFLRTLLS